MSIPMRTITVIPPVKIKKEIEEPEDALGCRLCTKTFCNEVAVRNHVRMEHADAYASGQPSDWMHQLKSTPQAKDKDKKEQKRLIKLKTEKFISSMSPASLTNLASADVSYIIIKADGMEPVARKRKSNSGKEKPVIVKDDKELEQVVTPFKCRQPSKLMGDAICHEIFYSCCEYSSHYRDHHARRGRKGSRCQICERPLSGEELQAPYTCQVCGTGFLMCKDLSEHINTEHVELKPFECTLCHKRFTQHGGLQQHMRMHNGIRPYTCTYCSKTFTQKSGLDQHVRIHTKVKPYQCVVCDEAFSQSVHLKQHMRRHTNTTPYQCGVCQKKFKQITNFKLHLRGHSLEGSSPGVTSVQYLSTSEGKEFIEVEVEQNEVELHIESDDNGDRGTADEPIIFNNGGASFQFI